MKLLKLADKCVSVLGLSLFGVLTGVSLFTTVYFTTEYEEIPYQKGDLFLVVLLVCAGLTFLMHLAGKWILKKEEGQERRIRILLWAVLLYTAVFGCLWVLGAHVVPAGDQQYLCEAAEGFRVGDYSILTQESYGKYLYIHPHQLGMAALLELVFALFGNGNYLAFELLNCLGAAVSVYSGYRITRLLTERKKAWIYYLFLAAGCFPLLFYVTFVYGEVPSIACSMAAVWLFLEYRKRGKIRWFAGSGVCICAAVLIRNNSVIVLIAMCCVLLAAGFGKRQWRPILAAAVLIAAMLGSRQALHTYYENRSGVEMNEGAPMILYVAMGMQEGAGAPGWSNGYILHAYWGQSDFDGAAAFEMGKQDIQASIKRFAAEPAYALGFFWEKFTSQWNDPTCECFAMTHMNDAPRGPMVNSTYYGKLHTLVTWFMNQYQSLLFLGVFLWLIFGFWRQKGLEDHLLLIVIFGGFLFSMIWEAKGRYILPYFVMMLPMAAAGLEELTARGLNWKRREKRG